MKKLLVFIIGLLPMSFLNSQSLTDAIQYGQQEVLGTARYRAMSGAFGALGGDISAIQTNPAGSAVFLKSYGSFTISSARSQNNASYFNDFTSTNSSNLNFNQIGGVLIFEDQRDGSSIKKLSLGMAYEQTADNFDKFNAFGRSNTSIDTYFLSAAQDIPLDLIDRRTGESITELYSFLGENEGYGVQQAYLGYEGFIIEAVDPADPNNIDYVSNIASGSFDQEYYYESTGLNGKYTLNGGAQINDDIYIGVNLNSHFINYTRRTDFVETNSNTGSNVNEVIFSNSLSTLGGGFSAQIGGIAKLSQSLRVGLAFESPTWYYIEEETSQRLETFSEADGVAIVNPDVINIFPEYRFKTPAKVTGSAALLFGKRGLISLDYSYRDYSSMKFSSSLEQNFTELNTAIAENFQAASTIRIGGEWRNGNWSFRGGYSIEESPYHDNTFFGDRERTSFGFGYNFGKMKFDFAYDYSEQQGNRELFSNSGFSNTALINNSRDNFTFTLGMNL